MNLRSTVITWVARVVRTSVTDVAIRMLYLVEFQNEEELLDMVDGDLARFRALGDETWNKA